MIQSQFQQQLNQQNAKKIIELNNQINLGSIQQIAMTYSQQIEVEIRKYQFIILILNNQSSEDQLSFINYMSDNQCQAQGQLRGVKTFVYQYQGVQYYFIQVNPQIQKYLDTDIANSSWLNTLFQSCHKLWVIIAQNYDKFIKDSPRADNIQQTLEFAVQFLKINPFQICPSFAPMHFFFFHNKQVPDYLKESNNKLLSVQQSFQTSKKELYKQEFIKMLLQSNNILTFIQLNAKDPNNKFQIMQKIAFLNSLNKQQALQVVQYNLGPSSNLTLLNYTQKLTELATEFMAQKDFINLKEVLENFFQLNNMIKTPQYANQFQKTINSVQYLFLQEIFQFINQFRQIIESGLQITEDIIQRLMAYLYQLQNWENQMMTPFFRMHQIQAEICIEIFEKEISDTFQKKLELYKVHNTVQDIQSYNQVLFVLKQFSQQCRMQTVRNLYDFYLNMYDKLIFDKRNICLMMINEVFNFKYANDRYKLNGALNQINQLSNLIQKQKELCSQIKPGSQFQLNENEITQNLQIQLSNLTVTTLNLIKNIIQTFKNVECHQDNTKDVEQLKIYLDLLDNILFYEVQFGLYQQKTQYDQTLNFCISECQNYILVLTQNQRLKSQYLNSIKINIQNLFRLTRGHQKIFEKCKSSQSSLLQKIYADIKIEADEIMNIIYEQKKIEQQKINKSEIMLQQKQDSLYIQHLYNKIQQIQELVWLDKELGTGEIQIIIKNIYSEIYQLIEFQLLYINNRINSEKFQWRKIAEAFFLLGLYGDKIRNATKEKEKEQHSKINQDIDQGCKKIQNKIETFRNECSQMVIQITWQKLNSYEEQEKYVQKIESYIFAMSELKIFYTRNLLNPLFNAEMKAATLSMLGSQVDVPLNQAGQGSIGLGVEQGVLDCKLKLINQQIQLIPSKNPQVLLQQKGPYNFGLDILRLIQFYQQRSNQQKLTYNFYEKLSLQEKEQEVKQQIQVVWEYFYKVFANNNNKEEFAKAQQILKDLSTSFIQFFPEWSLKFEQGAEIINDYSKIGVQLIADIDNLYFNCTTNQQKLDEVIAQLKQIQQFKMKQSSIIIPQANMIDDELNKQLKKLFDQYEQRIKQLSIEFNYKDMEAHYFFYRAFLPFEKLQFLTVLRNFSPSTLIADMKSQVQKLQIIVNLKDDQIKMTLKKVVKQLYEVVTYTSERQDKSLTEIFHDKLIQIITSLDKQAIEYQNEFTQLIQQQQQQKQQNQQIQTQAENIIAILKFVIEHIYKPPALNFDETLHTLINKKNEDLLKSIEKMQLELLQLSETQVYYYIKKVESIQNLEQLQAVDAELAKLKVTNKQLFGVIQGKVTDLVTTLCFKIEQELGYHSYANIPTILTSLQHIIHIQSLSDKAIQQSFTVQLEKIVESVLKDLGIFEDKLSQNIPLDDQLILTYFNAGQIVYSIRQQNIYNSQSIQLATQKLQTINKDIFELIRNTLNQYQQDKKQLNFASIDNSLTKIKQIDQFIKFLKGCQPDQLIKYNIDKIFRELIQQPTTINYQTAQNEVQTITNNLQNSYEQAWQSDNYQELTKVMNIIAEYQKVVKNHNIQGGQVINYSNKLKEINDKLIALAQSVVAMFGKVAIKEFAEQDGKKIQQLYQKLLKIKKDFQYQNDLKQIIEINLNDIQDKLIQFFDDRKKNLQKLLQVNVSEEQVFNIPEISRIMIEIAQIGYHVSDLKKIVLDFLDKQCLAGLDNFELISGINQHFLELRNIIGSFIVDESVIFQNVKLQRIFDATKTQNKPEYILSKMKILTNNANNELQKGEVSANVSQLITKKYELFVEQFFGILDKYIIQLQNKLELSDQVRSIAKNITDKQGKLSDNLHNLLIYLTAFWTLMQIKNNQAMRNSEGKFIFKVPHASQIFAIMFLLGFDTDQNLNDFAKLLQNQLIQIKTGEGKSIILGLLASFLALLGFQVDVVCYSKYLSERDYADFEEFFKVLKIVNLVKYSTFTELSNDIINQKGNIRDLSLDLLNNKDLNYNASLEKIKRILLIDEVDVFFSKDFYGQTYNPMVPFKTPEVTYIMNEIWNNRQLEKDTIIDHIFQSQEYQKLVQEHQQVTELINIHIRMMAQAVKSIDKETDYEIKDGKIGYLMHGQVSTSIYKGYATNFTYFKEADNMRISKEEKDNNTCINLGCGYYSYAHAPKEYQNILGVTGTLRSMHPESVKIIKNYISKMLKIPSMYGKSNLKFNKSYSEDIFILQDYQQYDQKIRQIAVEKSNSNRAVLIFFQDNEKLQSFKKNNDKLYTLIIDQNCPNYELKDKIKQATTKKQIVLVDRMFGRGTDFICIDPEVVRNNGVVVIQTYFSLDKSEEKQIKGRTARQSQNGEYFLILLQDDLINNFAVTEQMIKPYRNNQLYKDFLEPQRRQAWGKQLQELNENIVKAQDKHNQTIQYQQYLVQNNKIKAIEQLINFNKQSCHYILCLDDSGSMQCKTQGPMKDNTRWTDLMQVIKSFTQNKLASSGNSVGTDIYSVLFYSVTARPIATYVPINNLYQIISTAQQEFQQTYFHNAVQEIYKIIENEPPQYKGLSKRILFLTDGEDCEPAAQGQVMGPKLRQNLQNIVAKYQGKIKSWWNMLIGTDTQNTQVLEHMTLIMQECGGQLKKAEDVNKLEEEFNNLAFFYL